MLVLSRTDDQEVILNTSNGPVTVRVISAKNGRVKLGFDGSCEIYRRELQNAKDILKTRYSAS
jgi:sRNA-binding carbon storage regulator CsrA